MPAEPIPTPTPTPEPTPKPEPTPAPAPAPTPAPAPKSYTQEEVDRLLKKTSDDAAKKAKMSEDERLKAENDELKSSLRTRDARDDFTTALGKTAKSANLLFTAAQSLFEFDAKGKVSNLPDVIKILKSDYPEQFEVAGSGSADGGAKGEPTGRTMNDWMRGK